MTENYQYIINEAKKEVMKSFRQGWANNFHYHNLEHTSQVVEEAILLADDHQLSESSRFVLEISAWFHDTGYRFSYNNHEESSGMIAGSFLNDFKVLIELIEQVKKCIIATKVPQSPTSIISQILCDADLAYLGKSDFTLSLENLRKEWMLQNMIGDSLRDFYGNTLIFCEEHDYFTEFARKRYNKTKADNIELLRSLVIEIDNKY